MRKQAKGKENKENKKKRTRGNPKWAKVNELRSGDFLLMIFTAALVIFGIIMVFSASYYYSISQDGTAYSYLRRQIMWVIAGFCAMVFGAAFDYRRYRKFAIPFLILGVILLALIFTPLGHTANNATRWLKVGPITFMPGEFAKLFVIIFTAWFLSEKPDRIKSVTRGILPLVGIAAVYGLLIVKQPNLSTAITVCGIIVSMMLVAGMKWRYVFGTAALGGAGILSILLFMKDTYWYQRMTSFVDPFQDPLGEGYQAVQSLLALGSGGLFGVGLGKKRAEKPVSAGTAERLYPGDHRRRTRVYRDRIGSGTILLFFVAWRPCGDQCSGPVRHAPGFRDRTDGWNTSYFKYCGRNIFHAADRDQPAIYKLWRKRTPYVYVFSGSAA